jgi:two-component system, NarL family, sensor histidine kinase UhpB
MVVVRPMSMGPVGMRRLVDAATLGLSVATFARVADYEILLQALLAIIGIGAVLYRFTAAVARIVLIGTAALVYSIVASGFGDPLETGALDFSDYVEWPLMVGIAVVIAYLADRIGTSARRYASLYREASERLLTAQEQERGRLARDLHDGVGQTLTAVILTLDAAESELWSGANPPSSLARSSIQRAQMLASAALDEARDVAARLRPSRIHEIGLGAALVNLARDAGVNVSVRFDPAILPPGLLAPEAEIDVYRIVQEALSNAARHSSAKSIWLDAATEGSVLRLEVGDDGRGMDTVDRGDGLGLAGMEERATILDARLAIQSVPGKGTVIRLTIPIPGAIGAARPGALADARSSV